MTEFQTIKMNSFHPPVWEFDIKIKLVKGKGVFLHQFNRLFFKHLYLLLISLGSRIA